MSESTATVSSVAASATAVTLFTALTTGRLGDALTRTIFNDSSAVLYVKFGTAATSSSYTVQLGAGDYYELPSPVYDGIVTGIWDSATGNARLTQVTA